MATWIPSILSFLGGSLMTYFIGLYVNRGRLVFIFTKRDTSYYKRDDQGHFIPADYYQATAKKIWFEFDVVNQSGYHKIARSFVFIVKYRGNTTKYEAWNGEIKNPAFNFEPKKTQRIHLHTFVDIINTGEGARIYLHYFDRKNKERFAISEASHKNPFSI